MNYIRIYNAGLLQIFFIPAENDQSLNNCRVKCKQTEENYRIFHSFVENAEFRRFFTEFCRLTGNLAKKCGQFFFHKFSMMLIECQIFFLNTRKKSAGSTGNTGT